MIQTVSKPKKDVSSQCGCTLVIICGCVLLPPKHNYKLIITVIFLKFRPSNFENKKFLENFVQIFPLNICLLN